jgi:hypothetical protein
MFINRIYEAQNLLSLLLASFLVGLRTYQHPCTKHSMYYSAYKLFLYSQLLLAELHNIITYILVHLNTKLSVELIRLIQIIGTRAFWSPCGQRYRFRISIRLGVM